MKKYCFIILIFTASCTDYLFDQVEPEFDIVVNGIYDIKGDVKVTVSKSVKGNEIVKNVNDLYIKDAKVYLIDLILMDTISLDFIKDTYTAKNINGKLGNNYSLLVKYNDKIIKSKPAKLDEETLYKLDSAQSKIFIYEFPLYIEHKKNVIDYFLIDGVLSDKGVVLSDICEISDYNGFQVFSDLCLEAPVGSIKLIKDLNPKEPISQIEFKISNINKEYFDYASRVEEISAFESAFVRQRILPTNMENAYGFFTVTSSQKLILKL